jgi:hypothetical protein
LFSASIFLDWAILIFFSRSSSNIIVILFAINFYHRFWLFETFLVLDFVLKIAPQQGHRKLSIAKNILHIEHLFCPISYLEPFGTLLPLKSSQMPLQQYPIRDHHFQICRGNKGI